MNQIQVTCDKECIYCNDGFCECDQHLLDVAEEFLRLKRGEEVEHLKERESINLSRVPRPYFNMGVGECVLTDTLSFPLIPNILFYCVQTVFTNR